MAYKHCLVALGALVAASAAAASQSEMTAEGTPPAEPGSRYCLRVEPITGTRIETIRCETREGWALLEVDVDREWATEGVRVIGPQRMNG